MIASGARARRLGVPGEDKFQNKGLTFCAICDGPLFRGMDIAVMGGGSAALEAVDFVKDIAKKIYVVVLEDKFVAHEYLQESVRKMKNVEIIFNAKTKEFLGDNMLSGIKLDIKGKEKILNVKGVIVEIGRVPNTDFVADFVELDEHKHIIIDHTGATDLTGVYAAGDCCSAHEYQYIIAAGQSVMALLKIARYLAKKRGQPKKK